MLFTVPNRILLFAALFTTAGSSGDVKRIEKIANCKRDRKLAETVATFTAASIDLSVWLYIYQLLCSLI